MRIIKSRVTDILYSLTDAIHKVEQSSQENVGLKRVPLEQLTILFLTDYSKINETGI